MYWKLLAASVLTIGLATSAMAQSSYGTYSNSDGTYSNYHRPMFGNEYSSGVDLSTTGSINGDGSGLNTYGNPGPVGPCAFNTPGPDANAQGNVNDRYCGK